MAFGTSCPTHSQIFRTVTVTIAVVVPSAFVAKRTKVTVTGSLPRLDGRVACAVPDVTGVTLPTPLLMVSEDASVTLQENVTIPPPAINVLGLTEKLVMVGPEVVLA